MGQVLIARATATPFPVFGLGPYAIRALNGAGLVMTLGQDASQGPARRAPDGRLGTSWDFPRVSKVSIERGRWRRPVGVLPDPFVAIGSEKKYSKYLRLEQNLFRRNRLKGYDLL